MTPEEFVRAYGVTDDVAAIRVASSAGAFGTAVSIYEHTLRSAGRSLIVRQIGVDGRGAQAYTTARVVAHAAFEHMVRMWLDARIRSHPRVVGPLTDDECQAHRNSGCDMAAAVIEWCGGNSSQMYADLLSLAR